MEVIHLPSLYGFVRKRCGCTVAVALFQKTGCVAIGRVEGLPCVVLCHVEVMDCNYDRQKAKAIHAVEEAVEIIGRLKAVDETWAQKDLNLRPTDYESDALTN